MTDPLLDGQRHTGRKRTQRPRLHIVKICLTREELGLIDAAAKRYDLPLATACRRLLMKGMRVADLGTPARRQTAVGW